jgi:hypothetical protein
VLSGLATGTWFIKALIALKIIIIKIVLTIS